MPEMLIAGMFVLLGVGAVWLLLSPTEAEKKILEAEPEDEA